MSLDTIREKLAARAQQEQRSPENLANLAEIGQRGLGLPAIPDAPKRIGQRGLPLPAIPVAEKPTRFSRGLARLTQNLFAQKSPEDQKLAAGKIGRIGFGGSDPPCGRTRAPGQRERAAEPREPRQPILRLGRCDQCRLLVDEDYCTALVLSPGEYPVDREHWCAYYAKGA